MRNGPDQRLWRAVDPPELRQEDQSPPSAEPCLVCGALISAARLEARLNTCRSCGRRAGQLLKFAVLIDTEAATYDRSSWTGRTPRRRA
jgi:hypothetical protein